MRYYGDFTTPATKYSLVMEPIVGKDCFNQGKINHQSLTVEEIGLFVSKEFPFLGAIPDGLVHCACHRRGLLEIKCLTYHKEGLKFWCTDPNCPVMSGDMKTNHPCYYQMQHQKLVTNLNYCDFYVWSNGKEKMINIVRIEKDTVLCETAMTCWRFW